MIPLDHKMPNGATISDWLGTAGAAAASASARLTDARNPRKSDPDGSLAKAIEYLEQALEEAKAVRQAAAFVAAYDSELRQAYRREQEERA